MKKLFSLYLFLGIIAGTVNASSVLDKHDVIGEWKYEVASAPYGYQKGVISLTEKKNVLEGEVTFESGYKIQLKTVTIEGDTLRLGLNVDYEPITVTAKITEGKMEGTVDSSQGKMPLKAEKKL
jgi:hypothetical protein